MAIVRAARPPRLEPVSAEGGGDAPTAAQKAGTHSRPGAGSSSQTLTAPLAGQVSARTAAVAASSACTKETTSPSAASFPARAMSAARPSGACHVPGP
ncbi:hypothetical protein ACFQX6_65210 [Streptosporangium lutulentum]